MTREQAIINALRGHIEALEETIKKLEQAPTPNETLVSLEVYKQVAKERDIAIEQLHELGYEFGEKIEPTPKESCDDCMWSVCNYNKMVDCSKLLEEVSDKIEEYVCNEVEDHAKAQGMCDALTMIEDYFKENKPTPKESLVVEDCVSRADAIRVASGYCHPSNIAKELAKLPSVTPQEPRKGHWIDISYFDSGYGINKTCSECKNTISGHIYNIGHYQYCPNCGAKMEVKDDNK